LKLKPDKDAWDKFDLIGKFLAGVLVVAVGGIFVYLYNSSQQDRDRELSTEKQQAYQLETVTKFLPCISANKEEFSRTAILCVQGSSRQLSCNRAGYGQNRARYTCDIIQFA
jgi:hypothetical protein